jgi:chitin disaccharide deacetylase
MTPRDHRTCLIVTADDFGRSHCVNQAVEKAFCRGILKCASLMVNGEAAAEAIRIAKRHPGLQTSLHLTFTHGTPLYQGLSHPWLKNRQGVFRSSPAIAGMALQFSRRVEEQVYRELDAQFRAFESTGLPLRHVDCHHHLFVHPKLFNAVVDKAAASGVESIRIPYEPWDISGPLCKDHVPRNWIYRMVFAPLTAQCRRKSAARNIMSADGVFGLYQTGALTEDWLTGLLERLDSEHGVYELYAHPSTEPDSTGSVELEALTTPRIMDLIREKGISLIRYADMTELRR